LEVRTQATLAALKVLGRGDGGDVEQREVRSEVLEKMIELKSISPLTFKEYPDLFISPEVQSESVESVHAFNTVVACYVTGLWVQAPSLFKDPYEDGDEKVLLEGWAYAPQGT
jgi:hypothetical protein